MPMGLLLLTIDLCVAVTISSAGTVLNAWAQRRVIERSANQIVDRVAERVERALILALVDAEEDLGEEEESPEDVEA